MAIIAVKLMIDPMLKPAEIVQCEQALLRCWPAIETQTDSSWLCRSSGGYTARANSMQCLDPEDGHNVAHRLNDVQAFYDARGMQTRVRVTPLTAPELVAELAQRSWQVLGNSDVMTAELTSENPNHQAHADTKNNFVIKTYALAAPYWRENMHTLLGLGPHHAEIFAQLTARMPPLARGYLIEKHGVVMAGVIANIFEKTGHIFCLHVDASTRKQGLARALMHDVLAWMRQAGAKKCALQVTQLNDPAQSLYRSMGFEIAYSYHYCQPRRAD